MIFKSSLGFVSFFFDPSSNVYDLWGDVLGIELGNESMSQNHFQKSAAAYTSTQNNLPYLFEYKIRFFP
jgi:hypothetical protein